MSPSTFLASVRDTVRDILRDTVQSRSLHQLFNVITHIVKCMRRFDRCLVWLFYTRDGSFCSFLYGMLSSGRYRGTLSYEVVD